MLVTIGSYEGLSQDNLSDTVGDRFQIRVAGRSIKRNIDVLHNKTSIYQFVAKFAD